jgi:hypothetical protein
MGSGVLIGSLMAANLIDEYLLMIHPLVLGTGRRLFPEGMQVPLRRRWRHHVHRRGDRQLRADEGLVDEGPLGTHHAELVALGVGKNGPRLGAGLPDVHPPGT